jgi:hypothetical protein
MKRNSILAPLQVALTHVGDAVVTPVGLRLPEKFTDEAWADLGMQLGRLTGCAQWCLGDWWRAGENRAGCRAVVEQMGFKRSTLYNWGSVCGAFEISRRREVLSFSHHEAATVAPENERERWLDLAEAEGWSVTKLRAEINAAKRIETPSDEAAARMSHNAAASTAEAGESAENNEPDEEVRLSAFKSAVALLASLNRERAFEMRHGFKEYEEPAEKFVAAISSVDLADACDFLCGVQEAAENAERNAKKAKQIAKEAKNPEKARTKAREEAIALSMQNEMEEAKSDAREVGERWADIKDDWVSDWKENNWGDEEEADFNKGFCEEWQSNHDAPFPGSCLQGSRVEP